MAFVRFRRSPEPEFEQCQPLDVIEYCNAEVGDPIAVCGYPYGTIGLEEEGSLDRVGPVLQQGYVSALTPFNSVRPGNLRRILLDIRTAKGMSGAPLVRQTDGELIGIHLGGKAATMAFAIPLDQSKLSKWLNTSGILAM